MKWSFGTPELRARVERWAESVGKGEAVAGASLVAESHRRRLIRLDDGAGEALLLKRYRLDTGRHALWNGIKRALGRSAAEREWRGLRRARALGVPVPEPLGLLRLDDGDDLVIERFVDGPLLRSIPPTRATDALPALAEATHALHAGGLAHADLHAGNVILSASGPVLLDWQTARPCPGLASAGALRDLGLLDASLERLGVDGADRARLCRRSLGLPDADTAESRSAIASIRRSGAAARARHARNLTRRSLRAGHDGVAWRTRLGTGLRRRELDAATLEKALEAHRLAHARGEARAGPGDAAQILKSDDRTRLTRVLADGRAWIVKDVLRDDPGRRLADGFGASPARRAWRAAVGLQARDVPCARPVAFLTPSLLARQRRDVWLMEPLGECTADDPDRVEAISMGAFADALIELVIGLHRVGAWHADLKGGNLRLARSDDGWLAAPVDLEDVRFRRRLSDGQRITNLAQLNASLPEALLPSSERERAFARYAAALPFRGGPDAARARIVSLSLEREHAWRGADCPGAAQSSSG